MFKPFSFALFFFFPVFCVKEWDSLVYPEDFHHDSIQDRQTEMECTIPRVMCKDCRHLQICIGIKNKQAVPIFVQECKSDEVCMYRKGCVKKSEGYCNLKPFECTDDGMFPDPYDCKKYHICIASPETSQIIRFTRTCPQNESYDADLASCGMPLDTDACKKHPVDYCINESDIGTVGEGRIFYKCTNQSGILGPDLYRCPGKTIFNKIDYSCSE